MCISHSPDETEALGESWGRIAQPGMVIGLSGELGAGKTQLVKGLARGLGITTRVHSPTFALVNHYSGGRLPLFHLDLYRLDTPEQIAAAGLEEYLQAGGVTVIEWAERMFEVQSSKFKVQSSGSASDEPRDHLDLSPVIRYSTLDTRHSLRWVRFETLSENERRITYEDIGA
jgi:tRNA threonylcarbamoyladenosine biosynthesis protein TsaE